MYEARQNKEKVSRRIEGNGMAKQRIQIEDGKNIKSKAIFMRSSPFIHIVQQYSENKVCSNEKIQEFAIKRQSKSLYKWSSLSKNIAYSESYPNIVNNSTQSAHAEISTYNAILMMNNNPQAITIATERKPCTSSTNRGGGGCKEYFESIEQGNSSWNFTFNYLVNDDANAQNNLYNLYRSTQPQIPPKRGS